MTILLIILLFLFYLFFLKIKKSPRLFVTKVGFYFRIFYLFLFFVLFYVLFRFLNIFRKANVINLDLLFNKVAYYGLVNVFFFFCKIFIFVFRSSFLKVHYYLLSAYNFRYYDLYLIYFYRLALFPLKIIVFFVSRGMLFPTNKLFIFFFNISLTLILFFLFFVDIFFNGKDLIYFSSFLPWYSFLNLTRIFIKFIYNMDVNYDIVISNILYPLDIECEYHMYYDGYQSDINFVFYGLFPKNYRLPDDAFYDLRIYVRKIFFDK